MSAVEVVGWAGTASGTILGLPQVLRLVRTSRVDGLSLTAWRAMLVVNLSWTAHGISIGQVPQIVTSALSLCCTVPILYLMARELQRHLLPALLPGLLATGALIAVDQMFGSAAFGATAIVAAVVANAGQSIELVRSKRIVGVSMLFLIFAVVNQVLWLSWAILVPDAGTMIFATVTGIITVFNLFWWSLRILGMRPLLAAGQRRLPSHGQPASDQGSSSVPNQNPLLTSQKQGARMPNTSGNLNGKVAFVTGAASGIGRATALAFTREGANVVVADIDRRRNEHTVRMIEDLGGQAHTVNCDVTRGEDVQSALTQTVERFGRLNYAFNNAGAEQQPKPTAEITEEEWDRIIAINLKSVFLCLKYEIPLMLQYGGGAIVNTSSGAGIKVFGRGAAYAAAKHGVVGLTKDAALDYASSNIRINAICPGIIDTEMMDRFTGGTPEERDRVIGQEPIGRMGRPDEIAATVVWLCSEEASFVTGHAMVADGGQTLQAVAVGP